MMESKGRSEDKISRSIVRSKALLLAMSPIDEVLRDFCSQFLVPGDTKSDTSLGLGMQEDFARLVESCWTGFGPSDRYMKRIVMQFVRLAEKNKSEIESDSLANLVARASIINNDGTPNPLEPCYVSFFLEGPEANNSCTPLKIRVFPHHNDVALRLWEAGNCLAEFFIENPNIVSEKSLFELGSGCGATGLAIAASYKPLKIHLTDYTEASLLNMKHNLAVNRDWLSFHNFFPDRISQNYLEWQTFVKQATITSNIAYDEVDHEEYTQIRSGTLEAFKEADIIFAADVIYDIDAIDYLISLIKCFLVESPALKKAIIASTKRNEETFECFLDTIQRYGMTYSWLARNEECEAFHKIFQGNYSQKRSDVQICLIQMASHKDACPDI